MYCIRILLLMRWGKNKIEPVFLSKNEIQTINKVSKKLNVSKDEALKILIYRGLDLYSAGLHKKFKHFSLMPVLNQHFLDEILC